LTIQQASLLLDALPPLGRTMVGLAMLSGLRRGELFALRWRDLDEQERTLAVREAVYEGRFDTPKTQAGVRQIPCPRQRSSSWRTGELESKRSTRMRCSSQRAQGNPSRRTMCCDDRSSPHVTPWGWSASRGWRSDAPTHPGRTRAGVPGKVVAQLMGHAKVDTTLNVYTQW